MDESPFDLPPDPPPGPSAAPPTDRDPRNVAPGMPFSVSAAFGEAGRAFTQSYGMLLVVSVLSIVIGLAVWIIGLVVPCLNFVLSILIEWPLYPGFVYVGVRAVRDGRVDIEDLFIGYKYYGRSLLLVLLTTLAVLVVSIPAVAVGALIAFTLGNSGGAGFVIAAVIVMILMAVVPVMYVSARLGLAYGLIVDPIAGPLSTMDAIPRSWELTRDVAWPLTGLYFLVILVATGSLLLLGIGYILLGAPLTMCLAGAAYALIVGNASGRTCLHCGYSLQRLTGVVCPECGAPA